MMRTFRCLPSHICNAVTLLLNDHPSKIQHPNLYLQTLKQERLIEGSRLDRAFKRKIRDT
jgi:hypothetical protein